MNHNFQVGRVGEAPFAQALINPPLPVKYVAFTTFGIAGVVGHNHGEWVFPQMCGDFRKYGGNHPGTCIKLIRTQNVLS